MGKHSYIGEVSIVVNVKFAIQDQVYLKSDASQQLRIVTGVKVNPYDITYEVACGTEVSYHYDFELTHEKDYTK